MSKETKKLLLRVVLGTVTTVLLAFVIYIASSLLLTLIFYHDTPAGERDFTPIHLTMPLIFGLAFYLSYLSKYSEESSNPPNSFTVKRALAEFFRSDGKLLLVLYGILAIIFEIALSFHVVPITTALYPCFSIASTLSIPILRTVIAYIITVAMIFAAAVIKHYRQYKHWAKK